jgi:hypothetical protein
VINRHGEVEDVTDHDVVVDDACPLTESAHHDEQGRQRRRGDREAPPPANIPTAVTWTVPV